MTTETQKTLKSFPKVVFELNGIKILPFVIKFRLLFVSKVEIMFQKIHMSKIILMIGLLSSQNSIGQNVIRLSTQTISVREGITVESVQTSSTAITPIKLQLAEKQSFTSKLEINKRKTEKLPELSIKTDVELYLVKNASLLLKSALNSNEQPSDLFLFTSDIFSIRMTDAQQLEILTANGATFLIDAETTSFVSVTTARNEPDSEFKQINSHSSNHPKSTICCVQKGCSSKNDRFKFFPVQIEITAKTFSSDNSSFKISSDQNIWCAVTGRLYEKRSTCKTGDLSFLSVLSTFDCTSSNSPISIYNEPNPFIWDLQTYFI